MKPAIMEEWSDIVNFEFTREHLKGVVKNVQINDLVEFSTLIDRAKQEHLGCACDGLEGHLRDLVNQKFEEVLKS